MDSTIPAQRTVTRNVVILFCVAIAYLSQFWPEAWVYDRGMKLLGNPPFDGFVGAFLPHLLLFTTLLAVVSAILWWGLVKLDYVPPIDLGNVERALKLGAIYGVISFLLSVVVARLTLGSDAIRWIPPNLWKIAGNIFSNFYEEFVYRGFFLSALGAVMGFWPAAIISSVLWAALHFQYPLALRAFIVAIGILFCWLRRRAQSFWAPYTAHEVLDLLADCVIG